MNQLHIYIYPLLFILFSHLGHHRVLSRAPCSSDLLRAHGSRCAQPLVGWDPGPFAAWPAPGQTSPLATKYKETTWGLKITAACAVGAYSGQKDTKRLQNPHPIATSEEPGAKKVYCSCALLAAPLKEQAKHWGHLSSPVLEPSPPLTPYKKTAWPTSKRGKETCYFLSLFPAVAESESQRRSVMSDSFWPHGLHSPRNSPGQNIGVGRVPFTKGSSNPGIETRSPALQVDSLPAGPQGKPKNTGVGSLSLLQWILLTQASNQSLLHCGQILYHLSYQGSCSRDPSGRDPNKASPELLVWPLVNYYW